jgi:L-2-hydroxyglutarate oxidase LhgO
MEKVECVVAGAGVIGLAAARELALAGREVIILEAASTIGTETSSRNSEVIHAGLYYPPGSLKARTCVEGKKRLYAFCAGRGIEARPIGKLLAATSGAQIPKLASLKANAERCGAGDLTWLTVEEAYAIEPEVRCAAALFSPSSGIVDSHAFMLALLGDFENAGGIIAFNTPVQAGRLNTNGIMIATESIELEAKLLINAAGLYAPALARAIEGVPRHLVPEAYFAKGNYFALTGMRAPFRHLVYPMPEEAGLGIHATLDLSGGVRFGPDVEWTGQVDYAVDPARAAPFYAAIRTYWPDLPDGALTPAYSGMRPKIVGPSEPAADFMIQGPAEHGAQGLWNLFGIESPGLTASLALAALLRERIESLASE